MKITKRQLRKIIREAILNGPSEEVPADIQKKVDKLQKMGKPSSAVYDEETGEWRVEEEY
jgi:GTPase Era involved in 16S rRNA processing